MTPTSDPPPPGETDILERLRAMQEVTELGRPAAFMKDIWKVAADEIEHLRDKLSLAEAYRGSAELSERILREALRPFAEAHRTADPDGAVNLSDLTRQHFARAAELVPPNT